MTNAAKLRRSFLLLTAMAFAVGACDDSVAPPVGEPSNVQVRAFVDMDGSADFTENWDEPIAGATVTLTPSGEGEARTATTSADGLATFSAVEPGTYTVSFDMAAAPGDTELLTPSAPTVVAPMEGGQIEAQFRFAYLFDTIASIKALDIGEPVFIRGVVTAEPGTFRTANDNLYLQDATGGIQVFGVDSELGLEAGADVKIRGVMGAFSGESQIVAGDDPIEVELIGMSAVPAPREVTVPEIVARTYEGELVVTRMVRLVSVPGGTGQAYNLTFTDEDGVPFPVRIEFPVGDSVTRGTWEEGAGYDLTGLLGAFSSNGQLKPRGLDDIEWVAEPIEEDDPDPITIAEARAEVDATVVAVIGVVTVGHGMHRTQGDDIYLQDATAGLKVFGSALIAAELAVGDSVLIVGPMATFNDERQISGPSLVEARGTGTVPDAVVLGSAEFNALDHEGELVRIENVTLVEIGSADGAGRHNVTFEDAAGEMSVRIEGGVVDLFPAASWNVGATYTITGALGQFRGLAQLKPRLEADVVAH